MLQLRVSLEEVTPTVWRRLLVPGSIRLDKLHRTNQAMGWQDSHLHCFDIGGVRYGMQFDDYPEDEQDEQAITVLHAFDGVDRVTHEYDFGDGWEHELVVEARSRLPIGLKCVGVCLDGQHACPPEDCGGPGGYADLLSVLADPTHEEHEFLLGWVGGPFDPTEFDLALANARPAGGALTAGGERSKSTSTPWNIHFFQRDES